MTGRGKNQFFRFLVVALSAFVITSCSQSSSTLDIRPDFLNITGIVTDESGSGVSGLSVFVQGDSSPRVATESYGSFSVTIKKSEFSELTPQQDTLPEHLRGLHIFVSDPQSISRRLGASAVFQINERGTLSVGEIKIAPAAKLSGQVVLVAPGSSYIAAAGAKVDCGYRSVLTNAEGRYTFDEVPAGETTIRATMDGFDSGDITTKVEAGQTRGMEQPLILYSKGIIAGRVNPLPVTNISDLLAQGHPYRRSFSVDASPRSVFMRYGEDSSAFYDKTRAPGWMKIPSRFDYDFENNGGHTIYVQFTDASMTNLSPIESQSVDINDFADADGLVVIEDGSGIVHKRNVVVHLNPPIAARKMRLTSDVNEWKDSTTSSVWSSVQSAVEFVLPLGSDPHGIREIFAQFADGEGNQSVIYKGSVFVELFPTTNDILTINKGATSSDRRTVHLDIKVPTNAFQMRFAEDVTGSDAAQAQSDTSMGWLNVQQAYDYMFQAAGQRILYIQFRDVDLITSPWYSKAIDIEPFADTANGFQINTGDLVSPTRELIISLTPPSRAVAFRFSEDLSYLNNAQWLVVVPNFSYKVRGTGLVTIYLQYQDDEGNISTAYTRSVSVELFSSSSEGLVLGCVISEPCTVPSPMVNVTMVIPPAATQMAISVDQPPSQYSMWTAVRPQLSILLYETGPHTIFVAYMTDDGDVSPLYAASVIYAPVGP